jgi:hypothetical protein
MTCPRSGYPLCASEASSLLGNNDHFHRIASMKGYMLKSQNPVFGQFGIESERVHAISRFLA